MGKSAAAALLLMIAMQSAIAADEEKEKCYGIVRAGLNDCATAKASYAGSATKYANPMHFMPKSLCKKLVAY